MRPRAPALLIYVFLFISGATALVFEILWIRAFGLILGNTLYSLSCVITAFLVGLALGGALAARFVVRHPWVRRQPVLAYGLLELAAGIVACAITVVLFEYQPTFIGIVSGSEGARRSPVIDGLLAMVILAPPTLLMGASLPVVALLPAGQVRLSRLYGVNTLGAASGSLLASFVLIYWFGCLWAAGIAAAANAAVFAGAWACQHGLESSPGPPAAARVSGPAPSSGAWRFALVIAVFSGFTTLSSEVVWTRLLELILGDRVYVTSVALCLVLVGLGAGAQLSRALARRWGRWRLVYLASATALASTALGLLTQRPAIFSTLPYNIDHYPPDVAAQLAYAVLLVLVPATAMGMLFPLCLDVLKQGGLERRVGYALAANTLAGVAGALVASYVLLDWIGSNGVLAVNAALLAAAAGVAAFAHWRIGVRWLVAAAISVALAVPVIARGTAPLHVVQPVVRMASEESRHGVFSVARVGQRYSVELHNTAKLVYYFGEPSTQTIQELLAYLPVLYAPARERVLNIGLGYGITVGAFTRFEGINRIDSVEVVPAVVEHAPLFASGNYAFYEDSRVRSIIADGRHFLATTETMYDIITVNVEPYRAGSSSLFSRDFYEVLAQRLRPGGVFAQYLFGPDVHSLYRGVTATFPHAHVMQWTQDEVLVVASNRPLTRRHAALLRQRHLLEGLAVADYAELETRFSAGRRLQDTWDRAPPAFVTTDVNPVLEFRRHPGLGLFSLWHPDEVKAQ